MSTFLLCQKIKKDNGYKTSLVLALVVGFLVYQGSLFFGFSQDDFIHLNASRANNLIDILNFFNPFAKFADIFFYRPLTTYLYFFINRSFFGINPLPFHVEGLALHIANGLLFYFLVTRIWQNRWIGKVSAFFYLISAVHFLSLYYISAFQQLARTFFMLLAILTFINYYEKRSWKNLIFSLMSFIAALLSKEISVVLPFLFYPIIFLTGSSRSWWAIFISVSKKSWPFFIIVFVYFIIRIIDFQTIFQEGSYNLVFSAVEVFQNLKWYLIWSIGLPEVLASYPNLKLSGLIQYSQDQLYGGLTLVLALIFLLITGAAILIKKHFLSIKIYLASVLVLLLSLVPVLLLKDHKYPHYLDMVFLGVLPVLGWHLYQFKKCFSDRLIISVIFLSFIFLQFFSVKLSENSHYVTHRSKVAEFYHQQVLSQYQDISQKRSVVFIGSPIQVREVSVALGQKHALSTWLSCPLGTVRFQSEAVTSGQQLHSVIIPLSIY